MIKSLKALLLIVAIYSMPLLASAQSAPDDPGGDPDVPVDGGISLLLAAGVGYAVKKGYDKKKNNAQDALEK